MTPNLEHILIKYNSWMLQVQVFGMEPKFGVHLLLFIDLIFYRFINIKLIFDVPAF